MATLRYRVSQYLKTVRAVRRYLRYHLPGTRGVALVACCLLLLICTGNYGNIYAGNDGNTYAGNDGNIYGDGAVRGTVRWSHTGGSGDKDPTQHSLHIPILVLVEAVRDRTGMLRTLQSLRKRIQNFPSSVSVAFLHPASHETKEEIVKNFGVNVIDGGKLDSLMQSSPNSHQFSEIQGIKNREKNIFSRKIGPVRIRNSEREEEEKESPGECFGESLGNIRRKLRYLNTRINASELVDFYPKLRDRTWAHNLFSPHHNHPLNPTQATCFGNSYDNFLALNKTPSLYNLRKYFIEEENLELLGYPFENLPQEYQNSERNLPQEASSLGLLGYPFENLPQEYQNSERNLPQESSNLELLGYPFENLPQENQNSGQNLPHEYYNSEHNLSQKHHNFKQNLPQKSSNFKQNLPQKAWLRKAHFKRSRSSQKTSSGKAKPVATSVLPGDPRTTNTHPDQLYANALDDKCKIIRRFKKILQNFLDQNPGSDKFILTDDRHVFASDLSSFFRQSMPVFDIDPSVYCISTVNPLYPARLPPAAERNRGTEETADRHSHPQTPKPKYAPVSFLENLAPVSQLQRVDHFVGNGAVMVRRNLLEETIAHFPVSVVPETRSFPRPVDFVEQETEFPAQETGFPAPETGFPAPETGFPAPETGVTVPETGFPAPETGFPAPETGFPAPETGFPAPETGFPAPETGFPAPETGFPAPETGFPAPETAPGPDTVDYQDQYRIVKTWHDGHGIYRHYTRYRHRHRTGTVPAYRVLTALSDWLSWPSRRLLRGCVVPAVPRSCPISELRWPAGHPRDRASQSRGDLASCAAADQSAVALVPPQLMVRYRYYQAVYHDLTRATVLGTITNSSCDQPEFYPHNMKAGTSLLLTIKMLSYADDFSLVKTLECFGISGGGLSPLTRGQFDGTHLLQLPDASRLYILAVPLTRLTPEVQIQRVTYARVGISKKVVIQPEAEFRESLFQWDSIDVVSGTTNETLSTAAE